MPKSEIINKSQQKEKPSVCVCVRESELRNTVKNPVTGKSPDSIGFIGICGTFAKIKARGGSIGGVTIYIYIYIYAFIYSLCVIYICLYLYL